MKYSSKFTNFRSFLLIKMTQAGTRENYFWKNGRFWANRFFSIVVEHFGLPEKHSGYSGKLRQKKISRLLCRILKIYHKKTAILSSFSSYRGAKNSNLLIPRYTKPKMAIEKYYNTYKKVRNLKYFSTNNYTWFSLLKFHCQIQQILTAKNWKFKFLNFEEPYLHFQTR